MKVSELIKRLKQMPENADIYYVYDGEARGEAVFAWETEDGNVVISDEMEVVYSPGNRPQKAPGQEDPFWKTPKKNEKG